MTLLEIVEKIIGLQQKDHLTYPADVTISNGNILLRSFHLITYNGRTGLIKGLTKLEEYTYTREDREPVYCLLKAEEIKSLSCPDLELYFTTVEPLNV